MFLGTQHAVHFAHLQFTPSCASKRLKDVCGSCPVFCICPSHMSLFDWLQRGEWHQSGAGDWAVLIALWGFSVEWFLLILVLSGCNSKQGWDKPAEPEKGARLEESQQEADRLFLFFFVCLTRFVWTLVVWLCLIKNIRNIMSNHNPQSKLRRVYMFSYPPVRIKNHLFFIVKCSMESCHQFNGCL